MSDEALHREETDRLRVHWARFARSYDRVIAPFERVLFHGGRQWVGSRARGDVLEIGVGTGRNLDHYPPGARITGIDLSPETLEIARRRSAALGRRAGLVVADAEALPVPDASFDTVVSTLTMCTIPDHRAALAEARRVLRPAGRLVLLEHVRSPSTVVRAVQRALDPLSVRFAADHLMREPLEDVRRMAFEVVELERLKWGIVERLVAVKPGAHR